MLKIRLVILVILFVSNLSAQNQPAIINSGDYYHGQGVSFDAREAADQALEELTEQIAVRVSKSFERKISESSKGLDEDVKAILHTHSAATLKNVKTIKTPGPDGQIEVFCYLSKKEVAEVFNERKKLIAGMYRTAKENDQQGNVAQALKLYYFSMLLINSLPDENVIYENTNFTTEIPQEINRVMAGINLSLSKDEISADKKERTITLKMDRNGQPVALLDFTFWDGSNQVLVQGRDGLATFQLFSASTAFDQLRLNIKYAYYESRKEYNVIDELWPVVLKPEFHASKMVSLNNQAPVAATVRPGSNLAAKYDLKLTFDEAIPVQQQILQSTGKFLDLIGAADASGIRQTYASDPFLRDKLVSYQSFNHPAPLSKDIQAEVHPTSSGFELRKIGMLHRYPSLNTQCTEYLVLDFDAQGKLIDMNTSITESLYDQFVDNSEFGQDWERRQTIIKFIEKYRTAYLTRDLETVDLMFAEDALILVGRRIERKRLPDNTINYQKFDKEPDYEYLKLTKKEFVTRQSAIFKSQKDIFLNFSTFDIIKKNNENNVYGVEMRQSYTSTGYADEGYLFLMIDFTERDPLIYVRAWQPNEWDEEAKVKTANFRVYK